MSQQPSTAGTNPRSTFRGVHWCSSKQRWRAEIEVRGVKHKLRRFAHEIDAARAYDAAAVAFGVPERCNFWWQHTAAVPQPRRQVRRRSQTRIARG